MSDNSENIAEAIVRAKTKQDELDQVKFDKKTIKVSGQGFKIREIETRISLELDSGSRVFTLLTHALRSIIGLTSVNRMGGNIPGSVMASNIHKIVERLINDGYDIDAYAELVTIRDFFFERYKEEVRRIEDCIKANKIEYADLSFLFKKGDAVTWGENATRIGGLVSEVKYVETWMGSYCRIDIQVIHNLTGSPKMDIVGVTIPSYVGPIDLFSLPLRHLDRMPVVMAELIKRGDKFKRYAIGAHYSQYTGNVVQSSWFSNTSFRADGRIMIDAATFRRIDSDGYDRAMRASGLGKRDNYGEEEEAKDVVIDDDKLFMVWPYVFGFSFRAKTWGQFLFDDVTPIQYREDAFDRLVLDNEQKKMIRALVEHNGSSFSDIVDDKGGGCIFMLHGEPGQGKTLTAETVAELLHRPLYAVSVGELGTNPDALEERLREILDVATVWNAVLLLDEADIFLEARDEHDILRNAMVGVFLRLLEYHQGVLFLTTNRVRNIDRAFYSRISIAIKFDKADNDKREKIWRNLLDAAEIKLSEKEISKLAQDDINGRQIKNVIRLTQTLCKADKSTVTFDAIKRTIDLSTKFEEDMRTAEVVSLRSEAPRANATLVKNS